jgi:hypothetical protein
MNYRHALLLSFICFVGPAMSADAPSTQPATKTHGTLLTKHEDETFENQTVYVSGQAFIRCTFKACTLVVRESTYHLDKCQFERCNWHVDMLILWGDRPEKLKEIKALVEMLENAEQDK